MSGRRQGPADRGPDHLEGPERGRRPLQGRDHHRSRRRQGLQVGAVAPGRYPESAWLPRLVLPDADVAEGELTLESSPSTASRLWRGAARLAGLGAVGVGIAGLTAWRAPALYYATLGRPRTPRV